MCGIARITLCAILLLVLGSPLRAAWCSGSADIGFQLQDFLGRHWRNESVRFPLSSDQLKAVQARRALVGPDNRAVAYQIVAGDASTGSSIEFAAELKPFEARTYRFVGAAPAAVTDLELEETADHIRIGNSRVGIAIRKRLAPGEGPIESIRLTSGKWIGDSLLKSGQEISAYSVEIAARGPVFAEVVCRVRFGEGRHWELRLRLQAYEPVILVDETFSAGDGSSFSLGLTRNFAPDGLFYRHGSGRVGQLATWNISQTDKDPVFMLEPWLHWSERQRQGTWFGLYNDQDTDLVAIAAREAAVWVDPRQKPELRSETRLPVNLVAGHLQWTLPLKGGARRWMIGAFDKEASLQPLKGKNLNVAPLPQHYFIKHGTFPLNQLKDYVLKWAGDETGHPRLMVKAEDLAKWRSTFRTNPARVAQLAKTPLSEHQMDEPIAQYLATGDRELGRHLAATAVRWVQNAVDMYLRQDALVTLGFAPHHQSSVMTAINLADVIWSSEHLSPSLRERLKAQVAFLAYTLNREDYWSPERGFSANPNMTTTVAAYQAILGCMISGHPLARTWVAKGMRELKYNQLDRWSDENGGWLEAPHYALVSYDHMLGAFLAAYNAGFNEYLFHPKMKKVIQWLAKISTPPDSALEGRRALLPIGNTYMREPSGLFGTVAYLWKDRDPEFASEMQWMHRQHGSYPAPGVGGFFPTLAGYRSLLADNAIPEKAPAYKSEWFPRTGVMLRNHFPSNRESQLHLIAGTNHAHYDRDSGSFTLWGKGRVIANDFGYYGHASGEDHNMVVGPRAPDGAIMQITHFLPGDNVDYVRGVKNDTWERQIIFIKDPDPLGPNYFVISDKMRDGSPATWRTWFTAQKVTIGGQGATVEGREDIDTDVFFVQSKGLATTTEARTRETWGMTAGKYGRVSTTQTGLIVSLNSDSGLTTVIYPRLTSKRPPIFTPLAGGGGVKVETNAGTDYIFLASTYFSFHEGTMAFAGTVGAILIRRDKTSLWLGRAGKISAYGQTVNETTISTVQQ